MAAGPISSCLGRFLMCRAIGWSRHKRKGFASNKKAELPIGDTVRRLFLLELISLRIKWAVQGCGHV